MRHRQRFGGGGSSIEYLEAQTLKALKKIERWEEDALLSEQIDVLVQAVLQETWPEEVQPMWDQVRRSQGRESKLEVQDWRRDRPVQVPGMSITLTVPCVGDPSLLHLQASTYSPVGPLGEIVPGALRLTLEDQALDGPQVMSAFDQWKASVDKHVSWLNDDIRKRRPDAERRIRSAIEARRHRILQLRALDEYLPFHLETRGGAVKDMPIRITRQAPVGAQRRASHPYVPEYVLEEADYQAIVEVCASWGRSLERTPASTACLPEEGLRDMLLATLNSHWAGQATGETFNGAGKTDVLIRHGDRNVFVAECKIWSGPKAASAAVDQLLSYLVWRDAKACLIFFIRVKRPLEAMAKLREAVASHPAFLMEKPTVGEGERMDFVLAADEEGRRVSVAVLPLVFSA